MAKKYRIAVIPGDGTGAEVIREALKALDAASAKDRVFNREGPLRSWGRALSQDRGDFARRYD